MSSGTTYYYRVKAVNSGGSSVYSNTKSALTKPSAPTAYNADSISDSSFVAKWSSVTSASSYRLDVSTSSSFSSFVSGYHSKNVASPNHLVTGLSASTNYYYRVRAVNGSGYSSYSNTKSVQTTSSGARIAVYDFSKIENEPFEVSLYPNPTSDYLHIKLKGVETHNLTFNVFDVSGKSYAGLKNELSDNGEAEVFKLFLSGLQQGQYFIEITAPEKDQIVKRFIIK